MENLLAKIRRIKKTAVLGLLTAVSILALVLLTDKFLNTGPQILALNQNIANVQKELETLRNEDQYKVNQELKDRIKKSEETYKKTISSYERLIDLRIQKQNTSDFDKLFAQVLGDISTLNYTSASAKLADLNLQIDKTQTSVAQTQAPAGQTTTPVSVNNNPPGSGYSYQAVKTDSGTFNVAIIAADLNSTRVIIDTASDSDCSNNCPVMALGTYAQRSGAFAAINGSFFCPAEYPSCADKTNSFDTLLMNKNKVYFNSANNVYSSVPLVYFSGNSMGVRGQSSSWGRDTGVDAVIANTPLYVQGGSNTHAGAGDKFAAKGARTFVANKGSMVYIGIVYNATSAEAAKVLHAMGVENALGLDQGGSTALWLNGSYLAGPGRNIPNALLFVRK